MDAGPSRGVLLFLWVAGLGLLLAGLGTPVVGRTQEARVLETGREMLGADARGWLIPMLNGELRIQKPPLAYWAAAVSFKMFGVGEFAGRLPFAMAGWLTLAVVYQIGRLLFGGRVGLWSALALGSSFMFFRFSRLAETDVLAGLCVAAGVWFAILARRSSGRRWILWFQLMGVCIGLAATAKGLQAVFPILFCILLGAMERDWRYLKRFLISGVLLTGAVVGGWWFAYIRSTPDWPMIAEELSVVAAGEGHGGPFYSYFPELFIGTAPWGGVGVIGLVWMGGMMLNVKCQMSNVEEAVSKPRGVLEERTLLVRVIGSIGRRLTDIKEALDDARGSGIRAILIWGAVILIPLCIIKQKQFHYLVPMGAPAAVVVGYAIERALRAGAGSRESKAMGWVLGVTVAVCALAGPGILFAARHGRGFLELVDFLLAVILLFSVAGTVLIWRRQGMGAALVSFAAGATVAMAAVFGRWYPSLELANHRAAAGDIRQMFGNGPYCFWSKTNISYPMLFNLRAQAPRIETEEELNKLLADRPGMVVFSQTKNNTAPPPVPGMLEERMRIEMGDEGMVLRVYTVRK